MPDLFPVEPAPAPPPGQAALSQWFTPTWAAEELVQRSFPDLGPTDFVADWCCGRGAFLGAIPDDVHAVGVEVDPALAAEARAATGRQVLTGDALAVALPRAPTVIVGNPPFDSSLVAQLLDRAAGIMPEGGRIGWILPGYVFQARGPVLRFARWWSVRVDFLPRSLFPGIKMPILWARLVRERVTTLHGFLLHAEDAAVAAMPAVYRDILQRAPRSAWVRCVTEAMRRRGGRATLDELYQEVGGKRPSDTPWWREKVRQVAQRLFVRVGPATYSVAA